MNPNKMLWEKNDFTRIARPCGRVEGSLARSGQKGLGCWTSGCGTAGSTAANIGADVLGIDRP